MTATTQRQKTSEKKNCNQKIFLHLVCQQIFVL